MLNLSNVTLLCVETRAPELAHWAIERCLGSTQFSKVVLLTNLERVSKQKPGIQYIQAPSIKSTEDYSTLLLTDIAQYVEGSHVLIIQWDSFIINPQLWRDEFLQYDYIGAVWPHHPRTPVGNGGFSLRSVKLLDAIRLPRFMKKHPEDYCICADNKDFLESECGIKIAPVAIAEYFAIERSGWHDAFGFHGFFNFGRVLNDAELKAFIKIVPDSYLGSLDTYDLISYLRSQDRVGVAKELARRVKFKWRLRRHYMKLLFWLIFNKK